MCPTGSAHAELTHGLSRMMGNHQVRFLGEGAAEMPLPYPTPYPSQRHGKSNQEIEFGLEELVLALSEIRVFLQILKGRGKLANKGNRKRRGGYKPFLAIRD